MDRVPPLTILAALLLLGNAGCLSTDKAQAQYTSLKQSVGLAPPEPVSEVLTIWDPRLGTLNDPTRDGAMVSGLVGQVFMLSPRRNHAEARGDLAVVVYDTTARPQGQPERTPEYYHLTQETLAKLRTRDERFGLFYAMFLPWPAEWTDVTNVKVMARFQAPDGGTAIQAREVAVQLIAERGKVTWEEKNFQRVGGAMAPAPADRRGVPDPLKMLAALRGKPAVAPTAADAVAKLPPPERFTRSNVPASDGGFVTPAAGGAPVMTAVKSTAFVTIAPNTTNSSYATEGAYAGPKPVNSLDAFNAAAASGPIQPIIIRRD